MMEQTAFREAIDVKRREVDHMRRELELAEAELRGMERVVALLPQPSQAEVRQRVHRHTQASHGARLKPTWLGIMRSLAANHPGGTFDLDDLETAIAIAKANIGRSAARTQMYNYVQAGLLERINPGQFKFTDAMLASLPDPEHTETAPAEEASAVS